MEKEIAYYDLIIERIFDAPAGRVWQAWTEPELIKKWWGPAGYTAPVATVDLRIGGSYLFCMRSAEGKDYYTTGTYLDIVPFKRITASDSFADKEGNIVPASYYEMEEDLPLSMMMAVELEPLEGKTRFTLKHQGAPNEAVKQDMQTYWNESFDKMEAIL